MKNALTLILIRHAKSSWKDHNLSDFDRPLNDRGKRNAPDMGRWLGNFLLKNFPQDHFSIRCSSSIRTRKTHELMANGMILGDIPTSIVDQFASNIEFTRDLYLASSEDILDQFNLINKSVGIIICHNPGITDFFNLYSETLIRNVPTNGIGVFEFDKNKANGKLIKMVTPKGLAN